MPNELKQGDPCPSCGGTLEPYRILSPEAYRQIYDRDNPRPLPLGTDSAAPDVVKANGQLFVCSRCGYRTRFETDASKKAGSARAA
jgi:hypothetical protein